MRVVHFAVNGTLMRGLPLNGNLQAAGARFVREDQTTPDYRLWSIGDHYPAMLRSPGHGRSIQVEVWALAPAALVTVLLQEPPGLCVGRITLQDGEVVLGMLAEPYLCEGQVEITGWGGWRGYLATKRPHPQQVTGG